MIIGEESVSFLSAEPGIRSELVSASSLSLSMGYSLS